MKTTIFGVLLDVTSEQDTILRRLMRKYGFMLRFAFNRLLDGLANLGDLERHLASETTLPLRYAKDAAQEAQDLIRARHQAMQDGLTLWTQRVKKTQARLTSLRNPPPRLPTNPGAGTKTRAPRSTASLLSTACRGGHLSFRGVWLQSAMAGPVQAPR